MPFKFFQQLFLFFCFLLRFSNAYFWPKFDDDAFVAFVKGPSYFDQFCTEKGVTDWHNKNLLEHIYGTHLGVLHYIKLNLRCAKDRKKFEKFFGTAKCEQFQEYFEMFNILYEYLANVYAGHEVKMPIYKAGDEYSLRITLVQAVESLTHKAKLFFCDLNSFGKNGQILEEEEDDENPFKIQLESEQNLDYYLDVTITAVNREKFEKFMEEMMKKAMEKVDEHKMLKNGGKFWIGNSSAHKQLSSLAPPEDAVQFYDFILDMPLYGIDQAFDDEALFDLLRGKANIVGIFLHNLGDSPQSPLYENRKSGFNESFEIYLGLLFLMKKNWHCANAKIKIENECERFRQYVDILYEYLLRMRYGITAVKPMFKLTVWAKPRFRNMIEVIRGLNSFSFSYFIGLEELERLKERSKILNLTNEKELNYGTISDLKRNKFDKEMEAFYEKCIKIASEKKAELSKLKKEINELVLNIWKHRTKEKTKEKRKEKRRKYEDKFELMIDSPFTNKLFDLEES